MRKKRDKEDTIKSVLKAAESLFSKQGYSGTSIAQISKTSGISDGLILYHFKNKENLYKAVKENLMARYAKKLDMQQSSDLNIRKAMYNILQNSYNVFGEEPEIQRISLWSFLEGRDDCSQQEMKITAQMVKFIKKLQKEDLMKKDFNPIIFLTMIMGSIHYWHRYKDIFEEYLDSQKEHLDEDFLQQLTLLLVRAGFRGKEESHFTLNDIQNVIE